MIIPALALILGVAQPSAAHQDRKTLQVLQCVEIMEAGVKDGDRDVYLERVSKADPFLLAEQTHFADRIGKVDVETFELETGDLTFDGDRAFCDLTMTWRIDDWSDAMEWSVTTPVVFVNEGGDWRYAGENMEVLEGDGFQVRYFEGFEDTAKDVAAAFPIARAHADDVLGVKDTGPQVIKLYAEREQVVASVYLGVASWIPGWVEPGESMKFVWTYTRGEGWRGALAHEYGHVATFALGPKATDMPWWAAEGVAELASETFIRGYDIYVDTVVRDLAEDGVLRDWNDVANFDATKPNDSQWAYHQGHHMVGYITDEFGKEKRNAWLTDMANGRTLEEATTSNFGLTFAELDDRWRAFVGDASRPDPEAEKTIGAITSMLDAMEAAVLAGDKAGYLEHVARDDSIFFQEQINWAADFDHHIPASFDLEIDDVTVDGAWAEADLTMTWIMPEALAREDSPRHVDYRVGFINKDDMWLYAGEVWEQVPARGVVALCMPGLEEIGETAVEVFPEVQAHVEEGFGVSVETVQQIKVYASMRHLQASIYLSYEDPLSGWNEPGEAIKIYSARRMGAGMLRTLLAHEYGHVATFVMGEHATKMPWWTLEGVAELAAEEFSSDRTQVDRMVRGWATSDSLADWDRMSDFRNTPDDIMWHVYKQSQHFIGYISETYGREKRNEWLTLMAKGATVEDATQEVFGVTFEDLDKTWRAAITN